jgi:PAS domain S-box-containing protein
MLEFANNPDVESILQSFLTISQELLNLSHVSIELLEDEDTLVRRAATSRNILDFNHKIRRGEGGLLTWQAIERGQPAVLADHPLQFDRSPSEDEYPDEPIAAVPIYHRKQVIGVITFWRAEQSKSINQADIDVATHLARMIDLLLDNVNLGRQLEVEFANHNQMEASLRESRENFQSYFHMGSVGMCVTSPEMKLIETNGRMRDMLGFTSEELDQLTWSDLTHPEDLEQEFSMFNQVLSNQRDTYKLEKRFIRKDGSIVYTIMYVSCYRNPDGTVRYFLPSLVDITEQKQAEAALLKLAAVEERQRLARDLHDSVNQSIHSLVLFSETLVSALDKNNLERARHVVGRLQESARQALKEARLLLYQTQIPLSERSMNLHQELETRLASVERRAGVRAQIICEGTMDFIPPSWSENLFWITIEALNNALKHAQARSIKIIFRTSSQYFELEIIDDGRGFDPNRPHAGGMGLKNIRQRANVLGGNLEILSMPGKGSIVHFIAEIKK